MANTNTAWVNITNSEIGQLNVNPQHNLPSFADATKHDEEKTENEGETESDGKGENEGETELDGRAVTTGLIYPSESRDRGKVLIIRNSEFSPYPKQNLPGYVTDEKKLIKMWEKFGCEVDDPKINLKAIEIQLEIHKFIMKCSGNEKFCAVFILSHGNKQGVVLGSDMKAVRIATILEPFSNKNAQKLQEIPKLFFFQCCRGEEEKQGVVRAANLSPVDQVQLPEVSDTLVAHATQPNQVSFVEDDKGSWIMQDLVDVFYKFADKEHVVDMLTMINDKISQREITEGEFRGVKCMSEFTSTLRKKLYIYK